MKEIVLTIKYSYDKSVRTTYTTRTDVWYFYVCCFHTQSIELTTL